MKKINKYTAVAALLLSCSGFAQSNPKNKVGINTNQPTETLDINGTAQIRSLPLGWDGKTYNGAETQGTTFIPTKTVIADPSGNIGTIDGVLRPYIDIYKSNTGLSIGQETGYQAISSADGCISICWEVKLPNEFTAMLAVKVNKEKCGKTDTPFLLNVNYRVANSAGVGSFVWPNAENQFSVRDPGTEWIRFRSGSIGTENTWLADGSIQLWGSRVVNGARENTLRNYRFMASTKDGSKVGGKLNDYNIFTEIKRNY